MTAHLRLVSSRPEPRPSFATREQYDCVIALAHKALRRIDAGDQSEPFPKADLDAVADAVREIEEFARANGIPLMEFGR